MSKGPTAASARPLCSLLCRPMGYIGFRDRVLGFRVQGLGVYEFCSIEFSDALDFGVWDFSLPSLDLLNRVSQPGVQLPETHG